MSSFRSWILKNCKFAQVPLMPSVDDVNSRKPGIKDAEIDWDYYGRDEDGEKIYYPDLVVTYIAERGGDYQTKLIGGYGKDVKSLQQAYNEWAQQNRFVPVPIKDVADRHDQEYHEDMRNWPEEKEQEERAKQEVVEDRTMEEQLRKIQPNPTNKYPEKLR